MFYLLLNVFGGLAIFIFGMKMMSNGLHLAAGDKMRSILKLFSANRFVAILSGTAVTAVVQSSSASTVMVIGFVNAGLLTLVQAIGIIFGSNIGTTVTAQIVAFEISWIIMPAIILGLLMSFVTRTSISAWGETIMGLGFLFLGMEYMSGQLTQLSSNPAFLHIFSTFDCAPLNGSIPVLPLLGAIGVGIVSTMIVQSSSACTGIVLALGASGIVNLYTAVAIVLGSNIGTTVTAQLAAIPANRIAKQAALAHTLFNLIGVSLITATFWITWEGTPIFFRLVEKMSFGGDLPRQIANAHTIFNVVTTIILTPFIGILALVCERIIPLKAERIRYVRLEPKLLDTPAIAIAQATDALRRMLKKAWKMTDCALKIYIDNDSKNRELVELLDEREKRIDRYQKDITDYLSELMLRPLSAQEADIIPVLLHCTNDAERIGDHTAYIRDIMKTLSEAEGKLSEGAKREFFSLYDMLVKQALCTIWLLESPSTKWAQDAETLKTQIRDFTDKCESEHMKRLSSGECMPSVGVVYISLISEMRKVSRHLANISDRATGFFKAGLKIPQTSAKSPSSSQTMQGTTQLPLSPAK